MIYFIKDTVTQAVKIGYSKDPAGRLTNLKTATANPLVLLGMIHGGLEHETAYHQKFAKHRLQGEWFSAAILDEVLMILAKDAANPQQPRLNVIVSGDSAFSRGPVDQPQNRALVAQTLNELHAKTPIGWVITGGQREIDLLAWQWAEQNKVEIYRYYPKWRKHGRFAGFKVGTQLLRSLFDPKLLLVFLSSTPTSSTLSLVKAAEKKGIPVVIKGPEL